MLIIAFLLLGGFERVFGQEWVQSSGGKIPDNAFPGGTDKDGSVLYVCKAHFPKETCAGKVSNELGNCRIPYHDKELNVSTYEVLTSPPWEDYTLAWTDDDYTNGALPGNAVSTDTGFYVGRYNKDGRYIPGKIVVSLGVLYYGYAGREHSTENYEVLVKTSRSVDHYELYNVKYYLDQVAYDLSPEQIVLSQKTVVNAGSYHTTESLSMNFEDDKTREWSFTSGFEVHAGINITVTAELPIFGNSSSSTEVELGASCSTSYTHGGVYETSETTTKELTVNLPAYNNVSVFILGKRETCNIPYRGTLKVVFTNGDSYTQSGVEGMYTGVQSTSFETSIKSTPNKGIKTVSTFSIWITILFLNFHMNIF
ncbi:Natterin-1 [Holothuria leucospilota]|uniref:Natterin-1 n=1 Tax=Holothuria leucospilota TaxID=206669 RepID=A0A9Q1BIQ1_HOLLE|nr:Natterin-1 [Holothuria leucospilota]